MAEFQEVCKHLKRMCGRYGDNCIKCPLENKDFCSLSAGDRTTETYKKAEEIVMKWATEHPEPVYPTWFEWFKTVVSDEEMLQRGMYWDKPIPADIAQKLGITPKEK